MPGCRNKMSRQQLPFVSPKSDGVIGQSSLPYRNQTRLSPHASLSKSDWDLRRPRPEDACRPPNPDSRSPLCPCAADLAGGILSAPCSKEEEEVLFPFCSAVNPLVLELEVKPGDAWLATRSQPSLAHGGLAQAGTPESLSELGRSPSDGSSLTPPRDPTAAPFWGLFLPSMPRP